VSIFKVVAKQPTCRRPVKGRVAGRKVELLAPVMLKRRRLAKIAQVYVDQHAYEMKNEYDRLTEASLLYGTSSLTMYWDPNTQEETDIAVKEL
jgi:hypothetical protein